MPVPPQNFTDGTPAGRISSPAAADTLPFPGAAYPVRGVSGNRVEKTDLETQAALHLRIAGLRGEIDEVQEKRDQVHLALQQELERVSSAKRELANTVAIREQMQREIEERTELMRQYDERLNYVAEEVADAESKHSEWLAAVNSLASDHQVLVEKFTHAQNLHVKAISDVQDEEEKLSNFRKEAATVLAKVSDSHKTLDEHSVKVEALRNEQGQLAHVTGALELAQNQHGEISGRLKALSVEHDDLYAKVRETWDMHTTAVEALKGEEKKLAVTKDDLATAQAKLEEVNQTHAEVAGRVEALQEDEKRLAYATAAARGAEAEHKEWAAAVQGLATDHEAKLDEFNLLTAKLQESQREHEAMSARKVETVGYLDQLQIAREQSLEEQEQLEERLCDLRKTVTDLEGRLKEATELADSRDREVQTAEKKMVELEQVRLAKEQHVAELSGTEEKLVETLAQVHTAEAQHGDLKQILAGLSEQQAGKATVLHGLTQAIEESHGAHNLLLEKINHARGALGEETLGLQAYQLQAAATRHELEEEKTALQNEIVGLKLQISTEQQNVATATAQRQELQRQLGELAGTTEKLNVAKEALNLTEEKLSQKEIVIQNLETQRELLSHSVEKLTHEDEGLKGRLDVLRGREKDLRAALLELAQREHDDRARFEEIQRLVSEAESSSKKEQETLRRDVEQTRRELTEMEVRLTPMRDWKRAMDKRYERLATLPEDSTEARELWKEIEAEKRNLKDMIPLLSPDASPGGEQPSQSVLRSIIGEATPPVDADASAIPTPAGRNGIGRGKSVLHAPMGFSEEAEDPLERANMGTAGTGAMMSGTGQEMALKARLNRLRESVQREATRLEFLRQERAREESRGRTGAGTSGAGGAMVREQERQIDNKIRREEERLATIQRKIELTEVEEEKRRERIADLERRISELRADIAELERERGDARHKSELAQVELKSAEDALERRRLMGE